MDGFMRRGWTELVEIKTGTRREDLLRKRD